MKKVIDVIIDKLKLFKIIFYDFLIKKNIFINIILSFTVFIIIHFKWTVILGPFISSIITFNLINGYFYHQKIKQWNNNKRFFLKDFTMFIYNLRRSIGSIIFPIMEKDYKRHFDLDDLFYSEVMDYVGNNKYIINNIKELNNRYIHVFEEYSKYFTSIRHSKELAFN